MAPHSFDEQSPRINRITVALNCVIATSALAAFFLTPFAVCPRVTSERNRAADPVAPKKNDPGRPTPAIGPSLKEQEQAIEADFVAIRMELQRARPLIKNKDIGQTIDSLIQQLLIDDPKP